MERLSGASAHDTRPRRPFGLWLLTLALLASPLLHAAALLLRARWLNYGSPRVYEGLVYLLIALVVRLLMLRLHERALFSVYVLLSCEILRAFRINYQD